MHKCVQQQVDGNTLSEADIDDKIKNSNAGFHVYLISCEDNSNTVREWRTPPLTKKTTI